MPHRYLERVNRVQVLVPTPHIATDIAAISVLQDLQQPSATGALLGAYLFGYHIGINPVPPNGPISTSTRGC